MASPRESKRDAPWFSSFKGVDYVIYAKTKLKALTLLSRHTGYIFRYAGAKWYKAYTIVDNKAVKSEDEASLVRITFKFAKEIKRDYEVTILGPVAK